MAPPKRNLDALVSDAAGDVAAPAPLRRGRGVEGILSTPDTPAASPAPPAPEPARPQADTATSPHVNMPPASASTAAPPGKTRPVHKVSSYRIDPALARRVKVYAAMHDLNDYEVVEAALRAWLDAHERAEG